MPGTRLLPAIMVPLALLVVGVVPGAAQTTTVSNTAKWNGVDGISSFGLPSDATYGQTFKTPTGASRLTSFTFFVDDNFPPFTRFQGFVMAWDGLKATGPVLFKSGALSTTNNHGAGGFERINVTISQGVNLNPGTSYVAFFSASNFPTSGDARVGVESSGSYQGGGFVFLNNGTNISAVHTDNWDATFDFLDLAFEFAFAAAAAAREGTPAAPLILVVDQAAISSVLFSSVPTALAQRELALGASRTTLRDFNSRLFRRRAGAGGSFDQGRDEPAYHTVTVEESEGAKSARGGKDAKQVVYATTQPKAQRWEVFTSFDYGNLEMDANRNFLGVQSDTYAESVGVERAIARHFMVGAGV